MLMTNNTYDAEFRRFKSQHLAKVIFPSGWCDAKLLKRRLRKQGREPWRLQERDAVALINHMTSPRTRRARRPGRPVTTAPGDSIKIPRTPPGARKTSGERNMGEGWAPMGSRRRNEARKRGFAMIPGTPDGACPARSPAGPAHPARSRVPRAGRPCAPSPSGTWIFQTSGGPRLRPPTSGRSVAASRPSPSPPSVAVAQRHPPRPPAPAAGARAEAPPLLRGVGAIETPPARAAPAGRTCPEDDGIVSRLGADRTRVRTLFGREGGSIEI